MGILPPKGSSRCEDQGGFRRQEWNEEEEDFFCCPVNAKIRQLALPKIALRRNTLYCGRLVATTSESLMEILPDVFGSKAKKKKALFFHANLLPVKRDYLPMEENLLPIGIIGNEENSWMNALLQFVIFVSSIRLMFDYVPPSFSDFMRFIDLYHLDQIKNKNVTGARSDSLIERLFERFPKSFFLRGEEIDISLVLKRMMEFFLPPSGWNKNSNLLAYRPEWQLEIRGEELSTFSSTETFLEKQLHSREELPVELLLSLSWFFEKNYASLFAPQYRSKSYYLFSNQEQTLAYELDAFIEYRQDTFSSKGVYVTYIKVGNSWYQCFNERITLVRSNHLNIALERGLLFHYKRTLGSKFFH